MSVLLTRKRVFAAKIETTAGTPETLAGTDAAENFFDPSFEADIPAFQRQGQLTVSPLASVPGARSAKASVTTHLYNSGTVSAPFWASVLLPACGFVKGTGNVYVPQTGGASTLTLGHYVNGDLYRVAGAQGNVKFSADKVGDPIKLQWEYTGLYVDNSSASLLAPTFPTVVPVRFAGATITLNSVSYIVRKFDLDVGNKVTLREDAAVDAGYFGSVITDRDPKINLTIEAPGISTHDFFNDLKTATQVAFSLAVGSGTNNVVTIAAPKLQVRTAPKLNDADGIFIYDLEFGLNRSSSAGDDELSITLS